MPFVVIVLVAAIIVGYARGGRLHRVADAELGWSWLLFAGVALQFGVDLASVRGLLADTPGTGLLLISHAMVIGWIIANRFRPGMVLIGIGLLLNGTAIAVNGGMPVDPAAIEQARLPAVDALYGKHTLMDEGTRLAFLGDIIAIPPLRTVISIGDIVLAAGLIPLVGHLMTYRSAVERRGGPRAPIDAQDASEEERYSV